MSGLTPLIDTLLATRLAQRVDLVPLKSEVEVAGPEAVTPVEKVTNDLRLPSRAALQQQLGVGLLKSGESGYGNGPARSGEFVTLSVAARAVSVILDIQAGATTKIIGTEPLWPQPQPALAHLLSATLARTVANSGLFYESHLAQYAAGTRTLAQLAQEPQARLDATLRVPLALPGADAAGQESGMGGSPAGTGRLMEVPSLPGAAAVPSETGHDVSIDSGQAGAASSPNSVPAGLASRLDSAHLAAAYGSASVREKEHTPFHDIAGQETTAKNAGASSLDAVRNNTNSIPAAAVAAAIHPDAIALVRQQLELLAVPVFRWGGEVWPGTPMDWEIHQEHDERHAASEATDGAAVPPTWSTRLAMTLPTLGAVDVRLTLAGTTLQVHLAARENATLALLGNGSNELTQRVGAVGLQLTGFQIGALAVEGVQAP
ncbi:MAG TPA: hypothetical protein DCP03_03570 [Polaromonas sp.]|uniref:flagellar hook-length control protein FliK n=1 Tax=Polaromonas sp. UBA4122 TaxID=1947074 RepID=UPI000ED17692|nr:flagellar hook-length control protein FliK [Polaromonas sp. UBA4122]HAL37227.1 hypothetical protein [Polaromonas sp.]